MKTQLQAQSAQAIAVGHQHEHSHFLQACKSIYLQSGISGLWRGVSGALARVSVGSATQLSVFSTSKDFIKNQNVFKEDSWLVPAAASMLSGFGVVIVMTPFDVVCTRLYNQGTSLTGHGLFYNGFVDCCVKIFRREGIWGFYKGIGPHYFRIGPHTFLSLLFWDELRKKYKKYF